MCGELVYIVLPNIYPLYRSVAWNLYRYALSVSANLLFPDTPGAGIYISLTCSQSRTKGNTTATVDQHQVTYASVGVDAIRK